MKKKEKLKKEIKFDKNNDGQSLPFKLQLNKEIISNLITNSEDTGAGRLFASILHWVDCGAHSPHWCNTKCAGQIGIKKSIFDPTDRPECTGTPI